MLRISPADEAYQAGSYFLNPYLTVFLDSTEDRTIEEVASDSLQPYFAKDHLWMLGRFGADFSQELRYVWARLTITLQVERDQDWLISFNAAEVDMYVPSDSGGFLHQRSGQLLPAREKALQGDYGPLAFFSLPVLAGDTLTVFFKLQGLGNFVRSPVARRFDQQLFQPGRYTALDKQVRFWDAFIFGILMAVAIYHLIIFFYQRKYVSLFFSLMVLCEAQLILLYGGYSGDLLFPGHHFAKGIVWSPIYSGLVNVFYLLFSRSYLHLRRVGPIWDKIWLVLIVLEILAASLVIGEVWLAESLWQMEFTRWFKWVSLRGIVHQLILLATVIAAVVAWRKGVKAAIIYLVATLTYILQGILSPAFYYGFLDIPQWMGSGFGSSITALLFAMGIARQVKILEEEKSAAKEAELLEKTENQRIRELDEFKTRFYTHITHQFRTPLTIILGMVEQIRQHPTNWMKEGTKMIERNGRRLLLLVNQILNLSKLEAGAMPVKLVQGDVIQYIRYLVESFHSFAQNKSIHLKFEAEPQSLLMDYDADKLMDILSNLIANAIKFTPEGGTVQVSVGVQGTRQLQIRVEDDGQGITETDLPRIFDHFYQSERQGAADQGSGIGLALCRELVQLLGGEISVESQLEQGAAFTLSLPISRSVSPLEEWAPGEIKDKVFPYLEWPEEKPERADKTERKTPYTVLIVEDNEDVITYLHSILNPGFRLEVARHGKEGLAQARKSIPDLIVSDVMMPEMDGRAMCQQLKTDKLTSHIPIILLTAKADTESKIEGLEAGADAYLTKPFHKTELLVRMEKLIQLRTSLQERYRDLGFLFQPEPGFAPHPEDYFLGELREVIESHLGDPNFSIANLCQLMGMSRTQLYKKFKALTQQSLAEFIRKVRLYKAREFLQTTHLNVTQVAMEVGFKNLSSFSRAFHEEHGMTPSEMRKGGA
jgi:signal transduction histidine kinase/CheY-like chemotaxis protein